MVQNKHTTTDKIYQQWVFYIIIWHISDPPLEYTNTFKLQIFHKDMVKVIHIITLNYEHI